MRISEILTPSLIRIGLASDKKEKVFEEILQLLVDAGLIKDRAAALRALLQREERMSTGIAKWIGLPHGRLREATGVLMALGISHKGIEYDSLDGEPVYVVLMVFASEENPGPYIEILAEISRLFSSATFIEQIRSASTPEAALKIIEAAE